MRARLQGVSHPHPAPVIIPPPPTVRVAALLVVAQALGLVVLAIVNWRAGVGHNADRTQLGAQAAYFVVLAAALALVASGLLRGRRWARTPAVVVQIVLIAIGMWMAFPSEQLRPGLALIGLGAVTLALLLGPQANHWIRQFPTPFGIGQQESGQNGSGQRGTEPDQSAGK